MQSKILNSGFWRITGVLSGGILFDALIQDMTLGRL